MRVLKFKLSGETAFFKKPDVNTYYYFSYGCIHKVALLGILGAILGLDGYNKHKKDMLLKDKKEDYPQFYEVLKDFKIAIVPKNNKGYISKKNQTFNNSIGYASKEEGGNLIIKEQWLEKPKWDIYIQLDDSEISKKLENSLKNYKFEYIPYLGKNDHYANITDVKVIDEVEKSSNREINKINSLFLKKYYMIDIEYDPLDADDDEILCEEWKYEEKLPIALDKQLNQYEKETFIATNMKLKCKNEEGIVYKVENDNIFFF